MVPYPEMDQSPGELLRMAYKAALAGLPEDYQGTRAARMYSVEKVLEGRGLTVDDGLRSLFMDGANGQGPSEPGAPTPAKLEPLRVPTLEEFVAVDEPGAEPLVGEPGAILVPVGGDIMFFGTGGSGKTTMAVDLAFHMGAGQDWIGFTIPTALRVMVVENEGPRPLFRAKLRARRDAWGGAALEGRLRVVEDPWATTSFAEPARRETLANAIAEHAADVVFIGPLTRSGFNEAGTLREVREFLELVEDVRKQSGRAVSFALVHHDAKGGRVSGAFEGATESLLHVASEGNGKTRLHIAKARWSPVHHGLTLHLRWRDGGYELEDRPSLDDDTLAEQIESFVGSHPGTGWTKVEEATPGAERARRRAVRDRLLADGRLVNVVAEGGTEWAINECPERRRARLFLADDPTISHLRRASGADAAQLRLAGGEA